MLPAWAAWAISDRAFDVPVLSSLPGFQQAPDPSVHPLVCAMQAWLQKQDANKKSIMPIFDVSATTSSRL